MKPFLRAVLPVRAPARRLSVTMLRSLALLAALAPGTARSSRAQARFPPLPRAGTVERYEWASQPAANPGAFAMLAAEHVVRKPGASFLCFELADLVLSPGSHLELCSLRDADTFVFTPATWRSHGPHTPYFNGDAVRIRLWTGPGARGDFFRLESVGIGNQAPGGPLVGCTLCGTDDRQPSDDHRVGRLMLKRGNEIGICTAFLIGRDCLLTAGHCFAPLPEDVQVQFQVPKSTVNGDPVAPPTSEQYAWDPNPMHRRVEWTAIGAPDWALFHTKVNAVTNKHAGDAQGHWFSLGHQTTIASRLRVTGYGRDDTPDKTFNSVQQSSTGPLTDVSGVDLRWRVDVQEGNSGGPIIDERTQRVVGIVSYCNTCDSGWNGGTAVWHVPLQQALRDMCRQGLAVTAFEAPPVLSPGATVALRAVVENFGTTATSSFRFGYYADTGNGPVLIASRTQSLGAGQKFVDQRLVKLPTTLQANEDSFIIAWADKDDATQDPDPTDNSMYDAVPCRRTQADLKVEQLRSNLGRLTPGQKATVQIIVRNAGTETAPASWVMFYLSGNASSQAFDDLVIGWKRVPLLGAGLSWSDGAYELTIPECVRAMVSTTDLGALVDADNEVGESNEANNFAAWPVELAAEPMTRHVRFVPNRINSRPDVLDAGRGREIRTQLEFGSSPTSMCVGSASYDDYYLLAWSGKQDFTYDEFTVFGLIQLGTPLFPAWWGRVWDARTTLRPAVVLPPIALPPLVVYTHAFFFSPQLVPIGMGDRGIRHVMR